LSRTPSTAGNRKVFTWAGWIKRCKLDTRQSIFSAGTGNLSGQPGGGFFFESNNTLYVVHGGGTTVFITSAQVFRDTSAWFHLVVAYDTTQGTASDRVKVYVNGSQIDISGSFPDPNLLTDFNNTVIHAIGSRTDDGSVPSSTANYYLAEVHFIDGAALTPSSFTETDATTGQLVPKTYTGEYGTNGFKLTFSDNSNNTAITLGKDTSGRGNNWTPNNLSVSSSNTYTITTVKAYSVWSGGFRSANYRVDYSDNGISWTTAFSGTMSSNGCGIITGSGTGNGSYGGRIFWRYVNLEGGVSHHPRISRFIFSDGVNDYNVIVYTSDNCGDSGTILSVGDIVNFSGLTIAAGNDSLVDTPTNYGTDTYVGGEVRGNYCTLNPLTSSGGTYSQGNLRYVGPSNWRRSNGTIAISTGKWYWEVTLGNNPYSPRYNGSNWNNFGFGVSSSSHSTTGPNSVTDAIILADSGYYKNFSGTFTDVGVAFANGDVFSCAVDLDANTFTFRRNNTQIVTGTIGGTVGRELVPIIISYDGTYGVMDCNFGQRPFAYPAPSGFKALCTQNLPEGSITTSGTFTGNSSADGPFVYLNGVPTAMTINGNAVTFGTHADKLSNGFKVRNSTSSYNTSGSNTYSISSTGAKFKVARAQANP
jgi:hypothetical protein